MKQALIVALSIFPIFLFAQLRKKTFNENISFDFVAKTRTKKNKLYHNDVDVKLKITNNNDDTLYFLGSTCNGLDYSVIFDVNIWKNIDIYCFISYPYLYAIAPHSTKTYLSLFYKIKKAKYKKIKIGFKLSKVDRYYSEDELKKRDLYQDKKIEEIIFNSFEKTIQ